MLDSFREAVRRVESGERDLIKEINEFYLRNSPVHRYIGLELLDIKRGYAKFKFRYKREITRIGGMIHGGIIASVIDQVGGIASMTAHESPNQVTMELKINFLRPLTKDNEPYIAEAEVLRSGSRTIVTIVKIYDVENKISAVGLGTWFRLD